MKFGESAARLNSAASWLLGWRPHEFWNATPAELAMALEAPPMGDAPDQEAIEELRRRFPDE
jgi:hypothetical protein